MAAYRVYRADRTVPSACSDQLCFLSLMTISAPFVAGSEGSPQPGLCPGGINPFSQDRLCLPLPARGTLSSTHCQGKSVKNAQNFRIKFPALVFLFFFSQSDIILGTFTLNRMKWACSDQLSTTGWTSIFYFSSSDVFQSFLFFLQGAQQSWWGLSACFLTGL